MPVAGEMQGSAAEGQGRALGGWEEERGGRGRGGEGWVGEWG